MMGKMSRSSRRSLQEIDTRRKWGSIMVVLPKLMLLQVRTRLT